MARSKPRPTPKKIGWAVYLRTSDEEAQNPVASQARQQFLIERAVLERSDMPVIDTYRDVLTGRTPLRKDYQRMLNDACLGKFSHVVVERADRFGRNDTEALRAIDELDEIGVAVRFANHPDLDPIDPDDRVIVALSFTLARRESMLMGMRIKGACEAKRQKGGYLGLHPDGYKSVEDDMPGRKSYMTKGRHLEIDPERAPIWRLAWDLLLQDKLTLAEIAEELHAQGFRYRSGRPFIEVKANGKRKSNHNTLADIFHNWTYAGWVVSKEDSIAPKTIPGEWEPIVSTEEFERGLEILANRAQNKYTKRKYDYLLRGLLYLASDQDDPTSPGSKLHRMQGSTSNTRRSGGGTAHYRLERNPIHFMCDQVEAQIPDLLKRIQVDLKKSDLIRRYYINEVADKLGRLRPDERTETEKQLKAIVEEEARVLRLYAAGLVSEETWGDLWNEWQDKRQRLRTNLSLLDQRCDNYIDDLDEALTIIGKVGILYETLPRKDKRELLRNVVERIVLNLDGKIVRVDLLPPFAYLNNVSHRVNSSGGRASELTAENQTSAYEGGCSSRVLYSGQ
jgi:DNA invertase Pin-like site-specific DNA recombinase